jgi:hypothetical protein
LLAPRLLTVDDSPVNDISESEALEEFFNKVQGKRQLIMAQREIKTKTGKTVHLRTP